MVHNKPNTDARDVYDEHAVSPVARNINAKYVCLCMYAHVLSIDRSKICTQFQCDGKRKIAPFVDIRDLKLSDIVDGNCNSCGGNSNLE